MGYSKVAPAQKCHTILENPVQELQKCFDSNSFPYHWNGSISQCQTSRCSWIYSGQTPCSSSCTTIKQGLFWSKLSPTPEVSWRTWRKDRQGSLEDPLAKTSLALGLAIRPSWVETKIRPLNGRHTVVGNNEGWPSGSSLKKFMRVRSGQLAFARSQRRHKFKDEGTCPHSMINLLSNTSEVYVLHNFSDYCTWA